MNKAALYAVLFVSFLTLVRCGKSPDKEIGISEITTYRDIPGVTEEDISSIEALKKSREKFSYGQLLETEAFVRSDGTYAGFAAKFCNLLSELFGIEFALELHDWDSLKDGLDDQKIDFTGDLTSTSERLQFYYMTYPIAERSQRIFTFSENDEIVTERDINDRKIGFLTGTVDIDMVKEYYPELDFHVVYVDSFDSGAYMLKSGIIDAFVTEGVIDPLFDEYGYISSKEFFPLVYTPVSLTTANPDLKPVITVINKYISAGGIDKLFDFYKEGNDEYSSYKLARNFSAQEKAYLNELAENNSVVRVALEHDNYPFCFYNTTEEEFQGIAVDVLSEISYLTGIKFETANDKNTPWPSIMNMLRSGEVSLVSQLLFSEERRGHFLWTSVPYTSAYYALISKSNFPNQAIYQVVRSKVGIVSKSAYEDKYHQWLPDNKNIVSFNTQNEALDALESGDIDLMMASEYILLMQQNYREKPGYKVNIRFGMPMESYFGLNINEQILCSIIDKAQVFVKTDIITNDWSNRGYDYVKEMVKQRTTFFMIIAIAFGIMLILTVIFLEKNRRLNFSLDRTVRERTHELELQTRAAQVASKSKSVFLATMSHEIRTPLNAIIGMAGIAKKSISNPDKALASINQILSSSRHLLGILNDVLDMSKIDAGKLELSYEPFSTKKAYAEVSGIIGQRCTEKNIRFTDNMDEIKDLTLIGDMLRLNQVLINLLGNAVKFTPEGGDVQLHVDVYEEDDEKIKIIFSVTDTGIGMTEKQIAKLFIPFEQADGNVTAKFGGTGLGLSISQNLVKMMDSEIKVESQPNKGSRFFFDLTLFKGKEIAETKSEPKIADLHGKRILLVEDIEINRIIIREILSPTGLIIEEAENGQLAVEMFDKSPPGYYNLIFMDVQMPVLGGYEATRKIRLLEHPDSKNIPIVAMTANAYKEDIEEALSSGMNEHIPKPVDEEHVISVLTKFV